MRLHPISKLIEIPSQALLRGLLKAPSRAWSVALILFVLPAAGLAQIPDRTLGNSSLPGTSSTTWDLRDLYPTIDAWDKAVTKIEADIQQLQACKGKVASNAKSMTRCLTQFRDLYKELLRAYVFASLGTDTDLNNEAWQRRSQKMSLLFNQMQQVSSFYDPELVAKGNKTLKWLKRSPLKNQYDFYLQDLIRRSDHTLSASEENLLASASGPFQQFSSAYSVLMNAEIPWPRLATPEGDELLLNSQGYSSARQSSDRDYRELAFRSFFGTLEKFSKTMGNLLSGQVRSHVVNAKARGFESSLQARLYSDNLPAAVYQALVSTANDTLPTLHRYFRFRQRMLGLQNLGYYDIYPPLVPNLSREFSIEVAKPLLVRALEPLGEDYQQRLKQGLKERWMHVYPQEGKRSGAYMSGSAYDVHPYILLNYQGSYGDVSTLAHEWGHAIHSVYTNEAQPVTKADYSTFTAELASILPEVLLVDYMIENAATPEERLFYLAEAMEAIRGTFYRQTMFSEFEQRIHELAESGEVVDSASLSQIYADLVGRYHGEDLGIMRIPEYIHYEWAYIPHFYYNFYVFQYATSMAASFYMVDAMRSEGQPALDRFINVLKAGGSDYPYELMKQGGIDMASPDVYRAVAKRLENLLDQAEQALAEMDGRR